MAEMGKYYRNGLNFSQVRALKISHVRSLLYFSQVLATLTIWKTVARLTPKSIHLISGIDMYSSNETVWPKWEIITVIDFISLRSALPKCLPRPRHYFSRFLDNLETIYYYEYVKRACSMKTLLASP